VGIDKEFLFNRIVGWGVEGVEGCVIPDSLISVYPKKKKPSLSY
jgi:hypothetical protein